MRGRRMVLAVALLVVVVISASTAEANYESMPSVRLISPQAISDFKPERVQPWNDWARRSRVPQPPTRVAFLANRHSCGSSTAFGCMGWRHPPYVGIQHLRRSRR